VNWLVTIVYTILPCLVGVFAAALYLTRRSIPHRTAWQLAILIAVVLVAGATVTMRDASRGQVAVSTFLKAYTSLYLLPSIILTAVALGMRERIGRVIGIIVLAGAFVATTMAARSLSGYFLDLANARG
jgi:hypothetical protein